MPSGLMTPRPTLSSLRNSRPAARNADTPAIPRWRQRITFSRRIRKDERGPPSAVERRRAPVTEMRKETDSLGVVEVPADKLWGAQTQRSLEHFSIGKDLIPREMITSYAVLKKAAAIANHAGKRLDDLRYKLIVQTCDEILGGKHHDMFPLHVW